MSTPALRNAGTASTNGHTARPRNPPPPTTSTGTVLDDTVLDDTGDDDSSPQPPATTASTTATANQRTRDENQIITEKDASLSRRRE